MKTRFKNFWANTIPTRSNPKTRMILKVARLFLDTTYALAFYPSRKRIRIKDTILVTGTRRSGTTWLGNVLAATPKRCLVFEPVRFIMQKNDFCNYNHVPTPGIKCKEEKPFLGLLAGTHLPSHSLMHNKLNELPYMDALTIKCVTANRFVPWISNTYPCKGIVVIIRHPCAFVASIINFRRYLGFNDKMSSYYVYAKLGNYMQLLQDVGMLEYVKGLKTIEEVRAVEWCCEHVPFKNHNDKSKKWLTVSYEKLIMNNHSEFRRILEYLDLPMDRHVVSAIKESSFTSMSWSANHSKASVAEKLGLWQNTLNTENARRIVEVVRTFGIKGYDLSPIPNFEAINF